MMKDEKKIQDEELNKVSGGQEGDEEAPITCKNCHKTFTREYQPRKSVGSCSNEHYIWKCPNCGKYVDKNGNVEE